ncbi:MAG TPA: hypothetical protein VFG23_02400 [Polyangia bacterium]|nr:hypothetical protein [Polyangia bacterium]
MKQTDALPTNVDDAGRSGNAKNIRTLGVSSDRYVGTGLEEIQNESQNNNREKCMSSHGDGRGWSRVFAELFIDCFK